MIVVHRLIVARVGSDSAETGEWARQSIPSLVTGGIVQFGLMDRRDMNSSAKGGAKGTAPGGSPGLRAENQTEPLQGRLGLRGEGERVAPEGAGAAPERDLAT